MDLLELTEVKEYLNIVGDEENSVLNSYINFASEFVRKYTNSIFWEEKDMEEAQRYDGWKILTTNIIPVNSINFIKIKNYNEWVEISTPFEIINNLIYFENKLESGFYKISYKAGYKEISEDIKQACKILIAWAYNDNPWYISESVSQISMKYNQDIPEKVYSILDKYKNIWLSI